jgi:ATP-dependent protease ClpP protease subunit
MDSETIVSKPEVNLDRRHAPLGVLFAVLVLLIGAAATFRIAENIVFDWFAWRLPMLAVIACSIGVMFGIAAALVVLSLICWKHPQRRKASGAAGALFLVAALAAFLQGINAAAMIISAVDSYRNYSAYLTQVNAVVTKLEAGRISINGLIGPTLMEDIGQLHGPSEPIRAIEITSEGGLVDVAFALARMVEDQKISVVVSDYCLSACILIAVASPESYAEKTAVFGFHRVSPLAEITSEIWQHAVNIQDTEARVFLRQHGVPESILAESDKHGPDTVYEVSAKYMVDAGAIKSLMFNGEVIAVGPKH